MVDVWKFIATGDWVLQDLSKRTTATELFLKVTLVWLGHIRKRLFSYSWTYLSDRKEETPFILSWKLFRASCIFFWNVYYYLLLQTKSRGITAPVQQLVYKNGLKSYWTVSVACVFRWYFLLFKDMLCGNVFLKCNIKSQLYNIQCITVTENKVCADVLI